MRVGADVTAEESTHDIELRLLNTLLGSSPETMSQFVHITNINEQVAVVFVV